MAATLRDAFSTAFQVAVALESRWLEQPRAPAHELVFMLRSASLEERHRATVDLSTAIGDSSVATVETDIWTPLAFSPLQ